MNDCFIIMPISTPESAIERYGGDNKHFEHVLEVIFTPAIERIGMNPIPPKTKGAEIIHADIINNLSKASLVLCDMSTLNANVFFELGIRTALNKPVIHVVDDVTMPLSFDTSLTNYHKYDSSLKGWIIKNEIDKLVKHIKSTTSKKSSKNNALWKYFGVSQVAEYRPDAVTEDDKIDLILQRLLEAKDRYGGGKDFSYSSKHKELALQRLAYFLSQKNPGRHHQENWIDAIDIMREIGFQFDQQSEKLGGSHLLRG